MKRVEAARDMMLPFNRVEEQLLSGNAPPSPKSSAKSVVSSTTGVQSRPQRPLLPSDGIQLQPPNMLRSPLERKLSAHVPPLTLPSTFTKRPGVVSPADPYPSPPPSLDSPPNETVSLAFTSSYRETQVSASNKDQIFMRVKGYSVKFHINP